MCASSWVQVFVTFVFGAAATVIAWQQYRTNQEKIMVDLFDERFAVYWQTVAYLGLTTRGNLTPVALDTFLESAHKSQFLFGREMHDWLMELHNDGFRIEVLRQRNVDDLEALQLRHHALLGNRLDGRFDSFIDVSRLPSTSCIVDYLWG